MLEAFSLLEVLWIGWLSAGGMWEFKDVYTQLPC